MLPFHLPKRIQIIFQLLAVIPGDQDDRGVIRHANHGIDPEFPFPDGLLVRGEITVQHKVVCVLPDAVFNEPLQAVRSVGEIAVFLQVDVAGMGQSKGHAELLSFQSNGQIFSSETC